MGELYNYKALIKEAYDGDTVMAEIDLGFNTKFTEKSTCSELMRPKFQAQKNQKESARAMPCAK